MRTMSELADRFAATLYVAEPSCIVRTLVPYEWYKEHVLCGARDNMLPAAYVAMIEAVPAIPDPNEPRARRERAVRASHP